jgi:predicted dehydrogenase
VAGDEGFLRPVAPLPEAAVPALAAEGHAGVILDFVTALREGRDPLTVCSDNIKSLAMVFGAIESAETGRRVPVLSSKKASAA